MRFQGDVLYAALSVVGLLVSGTSAAPKPVKASKTANAGPKATTSTVAADPISMYSTQWFLNNVCTRPSNNECVFYTDWMSEDARNYAAANGKITIWSMWDTSLYNDDKNDQQNKLRTIMGSDTQRQTYFENMSRAMAHMCSGTAEVMDYSWPMVKMDRIWGRVEFAEIQSNNQVNEIYKISNTNPTGERALFWTRASGFARRSVNVTEIEDASVLSTRAATAGVSGKCGASMATSNRLGQSIVF
ncbi:hypothetical protein BX600DRAFT_438114 [Xylariales sp. PMI_506]|nr:hypothetical protein BX600DRAFT_438114 [Xylariales sp. PMI_506]